MQVCTIAEADINVNSAPGFIRAWRAKGYSVTLSPPEPSGCSRAALVSSLPFRPFRLPDGLANQRCAAGLFDFQQLTIVSFYGQSGNQPAAVAQATDVLAACTASQAPFIVAGDFNLEPTEAVLGEALAVGAIRSLDDAAQGAPLPATGPGRKRRIDHGVCHWSLAASQVDCFNVPFSDHTSVAYDVPLDAPAFLSMPKRSPPTDASSEDVQLLFEAADLSAFWSAIETADVDAAWQVLSDIAEQCLCTPAADPTQGVTSGHQLWRVPAQAAGSRALLL